MVHLPLPLTPLFSFSFFARSRAKCRWWRTSSILTLMIAYTTSVRSGGTFSLSLLDRNLYNFMNTPLHHVAVPLMIYDVQTYLTVSRPSKYLAVSCRYILQPWPITQLSERGTLKSSYVAIYPFILPVNAGLTSLPCSEARIAYARPGSHVPD